MKNLVAVINGEAKIEYDRSKALPQNQQDYLDKMDQKMDDGIPHGAGHLFAPDQQQKAQFVADQLVMAIKSDNEQLIAATMAYLALRLPDLQQVSADDKDGEVAIKFIYDKAFAKAEPVQFVRPDQLNS
ncbi:MAG: hypothetical protein OEZ38_08655 [Gammaproteobacteria bacterium]|nr:hypothetical protein [Gammaproteobacteria bacterium]